MRTIQRAIAVTTQGILWIVLLGFIALVALPRFTSFDVLIVRGGSMEPAVALGSVIVIDRDARDPAVGDIVSFREANGSIITHRVVAADAGMFTTKGDANETADLERRIRPNVVGTSVASIPYAGYAVHVLRQPPAFLLLLLGTGGFLIVGEIRTIIGELRRMTNKPTKVES
jgi:signal peptidase I